MVSKGNRKPNQIRTTKIKITHRRKHKEQENDQQYSKKVINQAEGNNIGTGVRLIKKITFTRNNLNYMNPKVFTQYCKVHKQNIQNNLTINY